MTKIEKGEEIMTRKLRNKILGDSLIWVIIAAFVVIMLFPFVYILSTALKSDTDLATSVGRILPKAAQWENFTKAWQLLDFPKCFFNSFIVAIAVTALTIFLCSLAAYVFTRLEFKGRNIVFILYLSTMMIPITVRLIPSYNLCRNLNMLDTYMGMILPQVAWSIPFGTFLMRQFYMGIPKQLDEAAKIDGATKWQTLTRVTIPNIMPSITICLFLTITNGFKLFDQNLALTNGQPFEQLKDGSVIKTTEMLALNIYNTFYGQSLTGKGVAQAKAVIFFILVAGISIIQLKATRSKEVQQ